MYPLVMRCAACGYELRGLKNCICPECGREFDPAQLAAEEAAGHAGPDRVTLVAYFVSASWPLLLLGWLHLMLLMARLVLGRWPHRYGLDDPKHVAVVGEMHMCGCLSLMLLPIMFIVMVASWVRLAYSAPLLAAVLAPLAVGSWVAFVVWPLMDPGEVWVWFWD